MTARPARPPASAFGGHSTNGSPLSLAVPPELVDAVAERVADLLADRRVPEPEPWIGVEQAAEHLPARGRASTRSPRRAASRTARTARASSSDARSSTIGSSKEGRSGRETLPTRCPPSRDAAPQAGSRRDHGSGKEGVTVSPASRDPAKHAIQRANLKPAPPAPVGNRQTFRHGGTATAATLPVSEAVREISDALARSAPVRDVEGALPAADEATVELAARALCRVRRVEAWCEQFGYLDEKTGDVKPAVRYLEQATRTADRLLGELGMNPRSRAALGLDLARTVDLATAMSEPDPARRAELMREAGVPLMEGDDD